MINLGAPSFALIQKISTVEVAEPRHSSPLHARSLGIKMDFRRNEFLAEMARKLDEVSPTFCPVKWRHATIHLASGHAKSCCHTPLRKLQSHDDSEFHDTDEDRNERLQLLQGKRPETCRTCWDVEDQGHYSDRVTWSALPWIANHKYVKPELKESALKPTWIELNFSSRCNLKCAYCSPNNSTSWAAEIKKYGPVPTVPSHNNLEHISSSEYLSERPKPEVIKRFWHWLETSLPTKGLIKLTGGEPFLHEESFQLFDWLIERAPTSELEIAINSNLMIDSDTWSRFVEYSNRLLDSGAVRALYLHPSIDGWGKQAEFIRHGLCLDTFERNTLNFLKSGSGHYLITASPTCLSIEATRPLYEKLVEWKAIAGSPNRWTSITQNPVYGPEWLSLKILPSRFLERWQKVIEFVEAHVTGDIYGFHDVDLDRVKAVGRLIGTDCSKFSQHRQNLLRYLEYSDRVRGTDFKSVFPELLEFFFQTDEHPSLVEDTWL